MLPLFEVDGMVWLNQGSLAKLGKLSLVDLIVLTSLAFYIENIIYVVHQTSYHIEEFNWTEPSS
jgi:hypothetical protein